MIKNKEMKFFLSGFIMMLICMSCRNKPVPVDVIFDTDIAPDYDDVGALAVLHALAGNGEAKILATISCNAFETTAPALSVINTYFRREDVPVGVVKNDKPNWPCPRLWAQGIISKYPHVIRSNNDAMDALKLYRQILSEQPDKSVTIISVGSFTNLAGLLYSTPDKFSSLNGLQLVKEKVKQLVSMAGAIDSTGNTGYESNVMGDVPASQKIFNEWPTPVILSGFEIGEKIFSGMKLIRNNKIKNSPVKDAYKIALDYDGSTTGHYSWDQTAVIAAVRDVRQYFNFREINFQIKDDGKDSVIPGNKIKYLTFKKSPQQIKKIIEDLMMYQPNKK